MQRGEIGKRINRAFSSDSAVFMLLLQVAREPREQHLSLSAGCFRRISCSEDVLRACSLTCASAEHVASKEQSAAIVLLLALLRPRISLRMVLCCEHLLNESLAHSADAAAVLRQLHMAATHSDADRHGWREPLPDGAALSLLSLLNPVRARPCPLIQKYRRQGKVPKVMNREGPLCFAAPPLLRGPLARSKADERCRVAGGWSSSWHSVAVRGADSVDFLRGGPTVPRDYGDER